MIINRSSGVADKRLKAIRAIGGYDLYPYHPDREPQATFVPIAGASVYEGVDFEAIANSAGELLLTTALRKDGLDASLGVIRDILRARGERPVVVMACENQVDSHYLRSKLEAYGFRPAVQTLFLRVVVDRICNKPELVGGRLEVACERFGRIYSERMDRVSPSVGALSKRKEIFERVSDFKLVVDRKKWLVNAPHLLMSLLAHYYRFPSVRDFTSEEYGSQILDRSLSELRKLMSHHYERAGQATPGLADFAKSINERIREFPQRYPDVVTRFSGQDALTAFFDDYHRKVTALALDEMHSTRADAPYFLSLGTHVVVELIKDRRWILSAAA